LRGIIGAVDRMRPMKCYIHEVSEHEFLEIDLQGGL
jgi:hypothetical protein